MIDAEKLSRRKGFLPFDVKSLINKTKEWDHVKQMDPCHNINYKNRYFTGQERKGAKSFIESSII